jgi:lipopolysaccharide/colanic/teichoic acid biosynthesis glycosyltransferase
MIATDMPAANSRTIHRMFDFVAAATGVILLAPIFLVTVMAIKLNFDDALFIREPRFGHGNRRIQLLKFRLVSGYRNGNTPARLTRLGRILF